MRLYINPRSVAALGSVPLWASAAAQKLSTPARLSCESAMIADVALGRIANRAGKKALKLFMLKDHEKIVSETTTQAAAASKNCSLIL